MCGVAGIYAYAAGAGSVDREELLSIRNAMVARGPDGDGLWIHPLGMIGLAHQRLSIIDLSDASAQPMTESSGQVRLSFNGEIYNYRELRRGLEHRGHRFKSSGDTEVLLRVYLEYGVGGLSRLEGMFAFALWDERKRAVLLARDPFGIKPLYYTEEAGVVRFASQVKALLTSSHVSRAPSAPGWVGFYSWGSVPEPWTTFRDIRAVTAGSYLWVDSSGISEPAEYCSISELWSGDRQPSERGDVEYEELIERELEASVRRHLVSDVPVGVFLSAGIDSGAIATMAARIEEAPITTVTLAFEEFAGTVSDEAPLAEAIARILGTNHQTVRFSASEVVALLDDFFDAMDQPTIDGLNSFLVNRAAAMAGLKVVLSGVGGDELFAGYPSFWMIPRMRSALRLVNCLPFRQNFSKLIKVLPLGRRRPKVDFLMRHALARASDAYFAVRGLFMPWELDEVLPEDLVREGLRVYDPVIDANRHLRKTNCPEEAVSVLEQTMYMRNQLLRDLDWASMAHSVEARVPFVDVPLTRTVAKRARGNGGSIGDKEALRSILPPDYRRVVKGRKKTGFSVPMAVVLDDHLQASDSGEHWSRNWARHCGDVFRDAAQRM